MVDQVHIGLIDLFVIHFRNELKKALWRKSHRCLASCTNLSPPLGSNPEKTSCRSCDHGRNERHQYVLWATKKEYNLIQKNMALSGSTNLNEYRELLIYQANLDGLFGMENARNAPQREHQQEEK